MQAEARESTALATARSKKRGSCGMTLWMMKATGMRLPRSMDARLKSAGPQKVVHHWMTANSGRRAVIARAARSQVHG